MIGIASQILFWLLLTWNIFFQHFIFNLFVSLYLNSVSCRQNIFRSFFKIYSVNICFFIGKFNPFTFEVLTDKEELTSVIMPFVFCMSYSVFVPHFYHACLLWWLITSVVTCFNSLIISFSVYSVKLFWLPWALHIIPWSYYTLIWVGSNNILQLE